MPGVSSTTVGSAAAVFGATDFKRREQLVRIVLDRRDAMTREQIREQPQHDLAVLQHVGDAGGRAGVVFEHVERVGVDAHDVDAGDEDVDVVRNALAVHLGSEHRVLEHQIVRHDAGAQHLPLGIDVLDVEVDRLGALLKAAFDGLPFVGGEHARDHVERDQPLGRVGVAIDREGDADPAEQQFRLPAPLLEDIGRHLPKPARKLVVGRTGHAVQAVHFVERSRHKHSSPTGRSPQCPC